MERAKKIMAYTPPKVVKRPFEGIVGQKNTKELLGYYLKGYQASSIFPHLLFIGSFGSGKTMMAKEFCRLTGKDLLFFNCGELKSSDDVFSKIVEKMDETDSFNIIFDEFHDLPDKLATILLSVLNPNEENKNTITYDGKPLVFDFRKIGFCACTTEIQSVFLPLRSRFREITLEDYTLDDIGQIIKYHSKTQMSRESVEYLSNFARGSGRNASMLGQEVLRYRQIKNLSSFELEDAQGLIKILDLFHLGLTRKEVEILAEIAKIGHISLTALKSKFNNTMQAQREFESYLLKNGLLEIDTKRYLTDRGKKYVKEILLDNK